MIPRNFAPFFKISQHKGVTIENPRAAQQTAKWSKRNWGHHWGQVVWHSHHISLVSQHQNCKEPTNFSFVFLNRASFGSSVAHVTSVKLIFKKHNSIFGYRQQNNNIIVQQKLVFYIRSCIDCRTSCGKLPQYWAGIVRHTIAVYWQEVSG